MIVMRTVVVHLAKMSELASLPSLARESEVNHWAKMYEMKNQRNWSEMRIHAINYLLE